MRQGENIQTYGAQLDEMMGRIALDLPIGIEMHKFADQPQVVEYAVGHFVTALAEAVLIVLVVSFIMFVIIPSALWGWYLWTRAVDQYTSTVGFSVRREEGGSPMDMFGGIFGAILAVPYTAVAWAVIQVWSNRYQVGDDPVLGPDPVNPKDRVEAKATMAQRWKYQRMRLEQLRPRKLGATQNDAEAAEEQDSETKHSL